MFNFIKNLLGFNASKAYDNVSAQTFEKMLAETPDAVLIDVRSASEFNDGHLPEAQNHNILNGAFQRKIAELDKTKTYFLYCRSSSRSGMASKILTKNGFLKVINMAEGIGSWQGKMVKH